jgi:ABC-type amino acid transport substrate-binding protein
VGIAVRKGDDALRETLNKAITAIRADGTYDKINKKYFPIDIFGR